MMITRSVSPGGTPLLMPVCPTRPIPPSTVGLPYGVLYIESLGAELHGLTAGQVFFHADPLALS